MSLLRIGSRFSGRAACAINRTLVSIHSVMSPLNKRAEHSGHAVLYAKDQPSLSKYPGSNLLQLSSRQVSGLSSPWFLISQAVS
ncbi:hypothetical protein STEG23_010471, partial [Scotinomys teguina]